MGIFQVFSLFSWLRRPKRGFSPVLCFWSALAMKIPFQHFWSENLQRSICRSNFTDEWKWLRAKNRILVCVRVRVYIWFQKDWALTHPGKTCDLNASRPHYEQSSHVVSNPTTGFMIPVWASRAHEAGAMWKSQVRVQYVRVLYVYTVHVRVHTVQMLHLFTKYVHSPTYIFSKYEGTFEGTKVLSYEVRYITTRTTTY